MSGSSEHANLDTDGTQSDQDEQPPEPQEYDFVVFYSEKDRNEAFQITDYLEKSTGEHFRGFLDDRNGMAGCTEIQNLEFALEKCKAYIILLTKSFLDCKFQTFKMHTSLHTSVLGTNLSNRLLPLLVDVEPTEMPNSLRIIQGIPYEPNSDRFWDKLKRSLQSICSSDI